MQCKKSVILFAILFAACTGRVPSGWLDVRVASVTLDNSAVSLYVNDTAQLMATISPSNSTNLSFTWSSSDTQKATVSSTGLVTAVGSGVVTISAIAADGAKSANCTFTVSPRGRMLIVAGNNSLSTVVYDGANHTFTAGPNLTGLASSGAHTISISAGTQAGKYVVVHANGLQTTSIYDVTTNTFSAGASTGVSPGIGANSFYIASGLQAGKYIVILANGAQTRIFDADLNMFSLGPVLPSPFHAVGSHNFSITVGANSGKTFIVGGNGNTATSLYDPATNTFAAGPVFPTGNVGSGAHSFPIPSGPNMGLTFMIAGNGVAATAMYDPATNLLNNPTTSAALTVAANTGAISFDISSGAQSGNRLILIGGSAFNYYYNYAGNSMSAGPTTLSGLGVGSLAMPITGGVHTGKTMVIYGGGLTSTAIFDPATLLFTVGPTLPVAIGNGSHVIALPNP